MRVVTVVAAMAFGCGGKARNEGFNCGPGTVAVGDTCVPEDAGADSDTDSDTTTDSSSDTSTDSGSDSDTATDSDSTTDTETSTDEDCAGGPGWTTELLVDEDSVFAPSVAVDSSGHAHIHYMLEGAQHYATNASGEWMFETIDPDAANGAGQIVLDADDVPHVVYCADEVRYGVRVDGEWTTEPIRAGIAYTAALVLDDAGDAHVVYDPGGRMQYATNESGAWEVTELADMDGNERTTIALDSAGALHVMAATSMLYYATNATGVWTSGWIPGSHADERCSFVIDSDDELHAFYKNGMQLNYAAYDDLAPEPIETDAVESGTVALDSDEIAHGVYTLWDPEGAENYWGGLVYVTNAGGDWTEETIDPDPRRESFLALGPDGQPRVVYVEATFGNTHGLYYARRCE